jgi:5'-nucleotidase
LKQRLIVDMDGVLADVYEQFLNYEEAQTGFRQKIDSLYGKREHDAFKNGSNYVRTQGFFRNAPVIAGSISALLRLNHQYELFIVSAATEFPQSMEEKYHWLAEHFPFISWQQMVFCGLKSVVKGDIMIDDHFRNLDNFEGRTILFTQPHNYGQDNKTHTRVSSWQEILDLLI